CAHARVAGQLSAADLQLHPDPAGRRIAVRVRRSQRTARDPRSGTDARDGPGAGVKTIAGTANETAASKALADLIPPYAAGGDGQVTAVARITRPGEGDVVYHDTRRAAARRRLDKTLDLLHREGVHATGVVVECDPVSALRDAIDQLEPDEIIVSTHPQQQ